MNVVDLFAGGGGASEGIRLALGVGPAVAVNHDPAAIEMHACNHPGTMHLCENVMRLTPFRPNGRPIDLLWASPDCTHHSRAKGGKPRSTGRRLLAWVVVEWARAVHPRVIALENVQEFEQWGPLDSEGQPIESRKGETFGEFVRALRMAGYRVEWRALNAADYGAPTSRKRLFLIARCDSEPVRWPEPTHGAGRARPWRTAAEIIDWDIPVPSIFDRVRPLKPATERRIAEGIRRFVLNNPRPFLVRYNSEHPGGTPRTANLAEPLPTQTTEPRFGLVAPTLVGVGGRAGQSPPMSAEAPLGTATTKADRALVVAAFLAKHYGGVVGQPLDRPIGTVTGVDHHSLVAGHLTKFYGSCAHGAPLDMPAPTVLAGGGRGGGHAGLVAAFLTKYYGTGGQHQRVDEPLHTVPTVDRFGLVTVQIDGEPWVLADIGMRMLQPRELANAQGFGPEYILTGCKREQVARIGNSVCPPVACAVVAAQFGREPFAAVA